MRKLALLMFVLAIGCGKKKDDAPAQTASGSAPASDKAPDKAPDKTPDKPAAAPVKDPTKLPGTWHIDGRPEVVWTFNADGTVHIKTSVTEYDGKYTLDGTKLTIEAKDTKTKVYEVAEMSDTTLALTDTEYSDTTKWVH